MYISLGILLLLPFTTAQNSTSAQNATAFALTYGYPLLAFHQLGNRFLEFNFTNGLFHSPELSTPANKTVVKPNVDTLYSAALLDLSQTDLSLTVPNISSSQYALFSFYDVFGDNYANLGTGNVNSSGKYRVRAPMNGTFQFGVQRNGNSSQYVADVMSPTNYGILLIRWGVKGTTIDAVHKYQGQTSLGAVNRTQVGNAPEITTLGTYDISNNDTMSPAEKTLNLLAKYAPWCQPETQAGAREVNPMLTMAGISNGMYSMPSDVNLETANRSAIATATNAAIAPSNNMNLNNGWSITKPGGLAGNFNNGTAYGYRTAIASQGFLMLSNPNAAYPTWTNSSTGVGAGGLGALSGYTLGRDEAILYTFSSKPPLIPLGFWSLTAYLDNYLIPNDLQRYAIGDRNNITYPDGSMVYGSNASSNGGMFQVLVQAADNTPPRNWTSNWLPGPAGGGNVTAILRWYGAEQGLLDGSYEYPVVTRMAAITNGSSGGSGMMGGGGGQGGGSGGGTSTSNPSMMPTESSSGASSTSSDSAASVVYRSDVMTALAALIAFVWWQA